MTQKTAAGLLGIAAVGCGGIAIANPEWVGVVYEPPWKPLSQDSAFNEGGYNDKFGGNHKNYLVGISQENKSWWDEKVKNIKKEERKGKFKNIDKGFDGANSLKELCNEAYKKPGTELKTGNDEPNENEFKRSDVWKYCSVLGKGPSSVKTHDRSGESNKKYEETEKTLIGAEGESSLISVNDGQNDKFWDLRNQEFYGERLFANGKGITVEPEHKFFTAAKTNNKESIKDICGRAYSMDSSNSTSSESAPTKDEVKKYCSLRPDSGK